MSLAQSLDKSLKNIGSGGWKSPHMKRSTASPVMLQQPDAHFDEKTKAAQKPHGNAKPQEPKYAEMVRSKGKVDDFTGEQGPDVWLPRKRSEVMHDHPKPWSFTSQSGKKENEHMSCKYHRSWLIDRGNQGRWNKAAKSKHYKAQDLKIHGPGVKCHDEIYSHGSNAKMWTHLLNEGTKLGGWEMLRPSRDDIVRVLDTVRTRLKMKEQIGKELRIIGDDDDATDTPYLVEGESERLAAEDVRMKEVTPVAKAKIDLLPPRLTGKHLKGGLYAGKYAPQKNANGEWIEGLGVKHAQVKNTTNDGLEVVPAWELDTREPFDNRLKDDMIKMNDKTLRDSAINAYDIFRPAHTKSCPQLGASFMHR